MKCDFCDNEANIEIVTFVNGEAQTVRLCSSCYKEKIGELVDSLPEGFGSTFLSQQLQALLEKAEEEGLPFNHMQIQMNMPFNGEMPHVEVDGRDMPWPDLGGEGSFNPKDENGVSLKDALESWIASNPSNLINFDEWNRKREAAKYRDYQAPAKTGREAALNAQRDSLLKQRSELVQAMNRALDEEDYEACARLRDQIDQLGDALIELNEERKKPNGV